MARPTIEIPDETKRTIWQLREKRKTLDQISRQTGLRYNVVQRFLANSDPRTRFASNPGTHVSVSDDPAVNRQSSEIIGPRLNSAPKFSSNPSPPSASQKRHWSDPESESTRRARIKLEEAKLSRQYWEEKAAGKRAFDAYIEMFAPKKKGPTFQPRPGAVLFEYSPEAFRQQEEFEMTFARGVYNDDPVMLYNFYRVSKWRWKAESFKIVYVSPENVEPNPQQTNS